LNILIVDDNARIRTAIKRVLERPGVEFSECSDGSQALERYGEIKPSWVLMDIIMPGIGGLAATRKIKEFYPEARIVIVTDHNDEEFRTAAREAGAIAYILKEDMMKLRDICLTVS
jgi:CheY-like chemotaxis protein